jgi:glycosyltransferase involved in cell wall biosynthesis
MNIPVVTTHVGYEGLELPINAGALLSMNSSEFANNTLRLLNDVPFRNETGKTGGELIRAKFSWEAIAKKLEAYLMNVQKGQD